MPPDVPLSSGAAADIRPIDTPAAAREASNLFDRIWLSEGVMGSHLIRAIAHAGGYAFAAHDGDGMVGASVGFLGQDDGGALILHSHITGVEGPARGLGLALKHHQWDWCAQHGVTAITWTFDPLVARNGWFNLGKLGAVGHTYLVNQYGEMTDGINAGAGSDRLDVRWEIADERPVPAPPPAHAWLLLDVDEHDGPVVTGAALVKTDGPLAVRVPADIEALRRADPVRAALWRIAVRDTMGAAMADGYQATSMRRDGSYVLTRPRRGGPARR